MCGWKGYTFQPPSIWMGIIFTSKVYEWGIFFTQKVHVYEWVKFEKVYMNGYNFRYWKYMNGSVFQLRRVYEWAGVRELQPHIRTQNHGKLPPPPRGRVDRILTLAPFSRRCCDLGQITRRVIGHTSPERTLPCVHSGLVCPNTRRENMDPSMLSDKSKITSNNA